MKANPTWVFPKTNWGTENGKNDPGLETFRGNPYPALAREPIQNSLDARQDFSKAVRVEFSLLTIDSSLFPGKSAYIDTLKQCLKYSKESSETKKEIELALKEVESEKIHFLKISDYNTTGLSGSNQLRDSNWHRLIKVVGDSEKEETSGGAFGIGKHAPFVCSNLKSVFYCTKDMEGKFAFQGVAKLITFLDLEDEPRQATGFFGVSDKIQPLKSIYDFDQEESRELFKRESVGTDLYVAGFDYRKSWKDDLIEAIITNFFVAIHEGSLEVKVDDKEINQNTLKNCIEYIKIINPNNKVLNYYEVLTNTVPFEEEDFLGLGRVRFFVSTGKHYHRKVAIMRKTGMLIKEKPNNNTPERYAGVLLIEGDLFNKELKRIENPTHTDWELKRKKNVTKIRKALKELDVWMNSKINSLSPFSDSTSINVDELSQFLPDESYELPLGEEITQEEGIKMLPQETKLFKKKMVQNNVKVPSKKNSNFYSKHDTSDTQEDIQYDSFKNRKVRSSTKSTRSHYDKSSSPKTGNRYDSTNQNAKKDRIAMITDYKLFCISPQNGVYKINITVQNSGEIFMQLVIIGEESNDPATVDSALMNSTKLTCNGDVIGPFYVESGKSTVEFKLTDNIRVAMGVNFNDN